MSLMISEEFGHGNFGPSPLSSEDARKFACLVRKRYEYRTCQPIGLHVRWHDMLVSFMESLHSAPGASLDYCLFWALRENQGQPYYHKARESFVTWVRQAYEEFKRWLASRDLQAAAA